MSDHDTCTDIDVAIESAVTTFAYRWAHGPREHTRVCERSDAEYWYTRGLKDGGINALEMQHEDMQRMMEGRDGLNNR